LPIHAVLPDLLAALRGASAAVLVAPPGAGKTTAVAPALLDGGWCSGEILLLSPRRLAARAAAERMAELARERVGETIGYATRLDTRRSARTRILVLTEGIFRSRIQADPELAGVSAVLFDEVHERSLDSDFGLALALDAQAALRPDLRLVAMSATLEGERFSALLGGAPVIESRGRSHPLELIHLGRSAEKRIEDEMAPAIRRALAEGEGSLLAFLPGVAEIERTAQRLEGALPAGVDLHRLHGSLEPGAQRAPSPPRRPGAARSSSPRRSPRPASRWTECASWSTQAWPGARATIAPPALRASSPSGPARPPSPSAPGGPGGRGRELCTACGRKRRMSASPASTRPKSSKRTFRRCCSTAPCGAFWTRAPCAGSIRRPKPRSTKRAAGCFRWARSARTVGRPRTARRSPPCRCRRASPTC
jgi:hypothetical protein